jgi:ribosomal protein S18 acetylase RimI-like enzyme
MAKRGFPMTTLPGQETLHACWSALAKLSPGAEVVEGPTALAAVFPAWAPLNNAVLTDRTGDATRTLLAVSSRYADAGVDVWAFWLPSHATDLDAPDQVREVGELKRDTTTLVMHKALSGRLRLQAGVVRTSIASVTRIDGEPLSAAELEPPDRVPDLCGWALVRRGVAVAGAWSYLRDGDCGIYGVETVPEWRRRGVASALVEHVMADAMLRGARTASLQSTRMGQPLYESLGFQAAGRYEEWIST